ncbi:hypothetical protein CYQ88_05850 [Hydrogenovibrio sp. SC-1]|uniref:DUF4377 domain-containing protein n=1 Tax=Hydrogenovibrio sp. SC-1 TaxID=2065820 RepID=UPI000C7CA05D|nr:DUF4377 domain-containing protein [Hydrogenovibrio sp. SC-1]PLA74405.1 hypothetical protein CYQ88_05850 [Hydrogenovibrio sp. SC-1]
MKLYVVLIMLLVTGLAGCGGNESKNVYSEIYIDHYKSECFGFTLSLCMRKRTSIENEWEPFYNTIEGFDYEWGYNYKLKVLIESIENPPEDAPSKKYTLVEVLSKEQESVTTTFDISVSRASNLVTNVTPEQISSGTEIYEIYSEKGFICYDEDCSFIDSLLSQDMAILFEFSHNGEPSQPLSLSQIKCSSSRESFRSSCL